MLRGKHKPAFTPHLDMGDNVIVLNAANVKLTGNKLETKEYVRYTGYIGGQKFTPLKVMMEKRPEEVILRAVKGMLPKTKLGVSQLKNLRVYAGVDHPHEAQQPRQVELA